MECTGRTGTSRRNSRDLLRISFEYSNFKWCYCQGTTSDVSKNVAFFIIKVDQTEIFTSVASYFLLYLKTCIYVSQMYRS
jgi:hypothetical protein